MKLVTTLVLMLCPMFALMANPSATLLEREVLVSEGLVYKLEGGDAMIDTHSENEELHYILVPKSSALIAFLNNKEAKINAKSLHSHTLSTEFQNNGKDIIFYHASSKNSANLYDKIAPKRFALESKELSDSAPNASAYIIKGFDKGIMHASCQILQVRQFVRDRARSEMLIDLDKQINPKLLSSTEVRFYLECDM